MELPYDTKRKAKVIDELSNYEQSANDGSIAAFKKAVIVIVVPSCPTSWHAAMYPLDCVRVLVRRLVRS